MPTKRSVLVVAHLTSPSVLSGAHRPGNPTKYLASRGRRFTVLTSLASARGGVRGAFQVGPPLLTERLEHEIEEACRGQPPRVRGIGAA